jgi:hypothetical protein
VIRHALALGGTVSGEHGVGVGKMEHIIVSFTLPMRRPSTVCFFLRSVGPVSRVPRTVSAVL